MQYGVLISFVIPIFNRAHLIPRIMPSVLNQSYRNFEVILVDDCSTDEIERAVADLDDSRIRLVRRAINGGAGAARNTGIEAARGDWIAFHDSDDFCTVDRLERSVRALEGLSPDYVGVYGNLVRYEDVNETTYRNAAAHILPPAHIQPLSGDMSGITEVMNVMNLPTMLVRKSALIDAGLFDPLLRQNEDWDICLRLTRLGPIKFLPDIFVLSPDTTPGQDQGDGARAHRISISARQGARSFMRITRKLYRRGTRGAALGGHYGTAGKYLMQIHRPRAARRFFRAALAQHGGQPRLWAHYFLSYLPSLYHVLQRQRSA